MRVVKTRFGRQAATRPATDATGPLAESRTMSANGRGALYMIICMAAFGMNDALIKLVSPHLGLFQSVFLRGAFATVMIAFLWWRSKAHVGTIEARDMGLIALRLIGEIGGTVCFLTAIFNMPLANATAILQAMPLAVTLAAAMFLGERVSRQRYVAIGIGFVGMLVIIRPGSEAFDRNSLWAIASCGFLVLRDLCTRQLPASLPSLFIALVTTVTITITGGAVALTQAWAPVSASLLMMLAVAAGFVLAGYLFSVMAMRTGDVGAVSPFRYSILIWASLLGIVLFDQWPDSVTLFGSALLVAAGVYSLRQRG